MKLEDAVCYWNDFYDRAEDLQRKFPNAVKIILIEFLSGMEGQAKIFEFLEIEPGVSSQNVFLKKGGVKDGQEMVPNIFSV